MKRKYERYVQEWETRYRKNGFVDWSLSNNYGDPFTFEEWLDKKYLHNF